MKRIFISDLHLGDGSKTDDFHRDKELLDLFLYADGIDAEVILLGDIYELWQGHLDKIMWQHPKVCDWIFNHHIFYRVFGNHDYLPFSKYWPETFREDGIFAQHGHQHDIYNRYRNPLFALKWPIGKYITLLVAEAERWVHKDADVWALKMKEKFGFLWEAARLQNHGHILNQEEYTELIRIAELNIPNDCKITVRGHTHKARLVKRYNRQGEIVIQANCGAWVDDVEPTYVLVDDDRVELRNGLNHKVIESIERN